MGRGATNFLWGTHEQKDRYSDTNAGGERGGKKGRTRKLPPFLYDRKEKAASVLKLPKGAEGGKKVNVGERK